MKFQILKPMIKNLLSSTMHSKITTFVPESKGSFPASLHSIIERRVDGKLFGCLKITAPDSDISQKNLTNRLLGILLDNSFSMEGKRLWNAIETIQKLAQTMSENHDKSQKFWMYLITFNSDAQLVIPLTEITPATLDGIFHSLGKIRAYNRTNYHAAFQLQNEVLGDIVSKMNNENPLHLDRFFLTDGEITEGSRDVKELYGMMRHFNAQSSTPQLRLSTRDFVFGYGTDVKLQCLQALSAQRHPVSGEISCSSLVTIMKPSDIGPKVGETVFNILNLFGANVTVSIDGGVAVATELFDYRQQDQSQVWVPSILLPSINCGDSYEILFQCPPVQTAIVTIKWDNLFTGESHSHEFTHDMQSEPMEPGELLLQQTKLVLRMIEIEIYKQMIAAETNSVHPDQIVQNAYLTILQLKELDAILSLDSEEVKCDIVRLLTDAYFIVGLITIGSLKEKQLAIWDRRICSGGGEVVNSGVGVARRYVTDEEKYFDEAMEAMEAIKEHNHESDFSDDDFEDDCISSMPIRMASVMPDSSQSRRFHNGSQLRRLCALIATARRNGDNTSAKELLIQMHRRPFDDECNNGPLFGNDDTFSSIPSDDPRRRRFGLIRQMSSDPQRSNASGSYVNIDASSSDGFVLTDPSTPSKRVCQSDNISSI